MNALKKISPFKFTIPQYPSKAIVLTKATVLIREKTRLKSQMKNLKRFFSTHNKQIKSLNTIVSLIKISL